MDIEKKIEILRQLETKQLVGKLSEYEGELLEALTQQADFTAQNYDYVASRGSDCARVKEILAQLAWDAPETKDVRERDSLLTKKTTVAEKDAWLQGQRRANQELADAITKQREVAFLQDDHQIKVEMAKKRLEGTKAVLALKTQQIAFLAGD